MSPTDLGAIIEDAMLLLEREMRKYRVSVETEIHPDTLLRWQTEIKSREFC